MNDQSTARLFDGPALRTALRREAAPALKTWPSPKIWQLGLEAPGDPWSTAALFEEEGLLDRLTVYATDADPDRVSASGAAAFAAADVRSPVRARIAFFHHDPREDASFNEFQLVLWRPSGRDDLDEAGARRIRESLCRFGLLGVLGERLPAASLSRAWPRRLAPRLFRRET